MPTACIMIATTGLVAFVVHEALEVILALLSNAPTLGVVVGVTSSLAGAVMTTCLAPAVICACAFSALVKNPVKYAFALGLLLVGDFSLGTRAEY